MKIALASDHAGFQYKQALIDHLRKLGHEVKDFGTYSEERTDYPQWIRPAAQALARGEFDRAIVLGGSGNGEAMVANKVRGVRCAYCCNEETARLGRAHNDANCIAIGQRIIPLDLALRCAEVFLATPFDAGRHLPRVQAIDA